MSDLVESSPILVNNDVIDESHIMIEGISRHHDDDDDDDDDQEEGKLVASLHHVLEQDEKSSSQTQITSSHHTEPEPAPITVTALSSIQSLVSSLPHNIPPLSHQSSLSSLATSSPDPPSPTSTIQSLDDDELAEQVMPHEDVKEEKCVAEGERNTSATTTSPSKQIETTPVIPPEHTTLINTMTSMGFALPSLMRAITALSAPQHHPRAPSIHIDAIMEWMEIHPDNGMIDGFDSSLVTHVMSLTGCTQQQACDALRMHQSDLSNTVVWLLEQADQERKNDDDADVDVDVGDDVEHRYLHYGDCIVLRSASNQRYMGVHVVNEETDSTGINTTGTPSTPSMYLKGISYDKDKILDYSHEKRKLSYGRELTTLLSLSPQPKPLTASPALTPNDTATTTDTAEEEGAEGHTTDNNNTTTGSPVTVTIPQALPMSDTLILDLPSDGRVYATCHTITDDCWFIVRHPTNIQDTSVVKGGNKIALETNQGFYVGVEANGHVTGHRGSPINELMEWRLLHTTQRDSKQPFMINNINIMLESCQTHLLQMEEDGYACSAKTKSTAHATWAITLQNNEKAAKQFSWLDHPACAHPATAQGRWASLRTHFRLVALRILKHDVDLLQSQVRQQRKDAQRRMNEDKACAICLDKQPNTAMVPCGHVTACDECGPSLTSCPICRDPITRVVVFKT